MKEEKEVVTLDNFPLRFELCLSSIDSLFRGSFKRHEESFMKTYNGTLLQMKKLFVSVREENERLRKELVQDSRFSRLQKERDDYREKAEVLYSENENLSNKLKKRNQELNELNSEVLALRGVLHIKSRESFFKQRSGDLLGRESKINEKFDISELKTVKRVSHSSAAKNFNSTASTNHLRYDQQSKNYVENDQNFGKSPDFFKKKKKGVLSVDMRPKKQKIFNGLLDFKNENVNVDSGVLLKAFGVKKCEETENRMFSCRTNSWNVAGSRRSAKQNEAE